LATLNVLENIRELQKPSVIISNKFPGAEITLFQSEVDEG